MREMPTVAHETNQSQQRLGSAAPKAPRKPGPTLEPPPTNAAKFHFDTFGANFFTYAKACALSNAGIMPSV